jgi:hypothetical protein
MRSSVSRLDARRTIFYKGRALVFCFGESQNISVALTFTFVSSHCEKNYYRVTEHLFMPFTYIFL